VTMMDDYPYAYLDNVPDDSPQMRPYQRTGALRYYRVRKSDPRVLCEEWNSPGGGEPFWRQVPHGRHAERRGPWGYTGHEAFLSRPIPKGNLYPVNKVRGRP
jgi:hypothetical protein